MRHHKIIKALYKRTFRSKHKQPMAAAIVVGNRIISFGINQNIKGHPKQQPRPGWIRQASIHAELDALIRADYNLISGSAVYVVRRKIIDGSYGLARPCNGCLKLLIDYGIKKIIYTIDTGFGQTDCFMEEEL
jgi:deoxycytidylate deaminase